MCLSLLCNWDQQELVVCGTAGGAVWSLHPELEHSGFPGGNSRPAPGLMAASRLGSPGNKLRAIQRAWISLCKHEMQPVYDTVHPLLVEINQRISRYTPSNMSAAGCTWECRARTSTRRPAGLLAPRQHQLFLTCAGSYRVHSCRHWAGRRRWLKPAQHPRRQDRVERPRVSQPNPRAAISTVPISTFFPRGMGAPSWQDFLLSIRFRTTSLLVFHKHFNPQITVQTKVYCIVRMGLV